MTLLLFGILLLALLILLGARAETWWVGSMALQIRPQLAIAALVLGTIISIEGETILAVSALVLGGIALLPLTTSPSRVPLSDSLTSASTATRFRIYVANLNADNGDHARIVQSMASSDADLIVAVEVSFETWEKVSSAFEECFQFGGHRIYRGTRYGAAWLSKTRPDAVSMKGDDIAESSPLCVRLRDPQIEVRAIHPLTPTNPGWFNRRTDYLRSSLQMDTEVAAVLYCGDFNAVPWDPVLSQLVERAGLKMVGPRRIWRGSWPRLPIPFRIPLDHALLKGSGCGRVEYGLPTGSDHLPLIVDLQLPQQ